MKQLIRKFKQISILILAITFVGCEDDEAVLPQVIAGFTYTLNADTGTVTFINISENSKRYDWDFGDGSTSKEINPIKTYANGTYTITLKASNVAGASNSFEDEVTVSIPDPISLPVTFDDQNVAYDVAIFGGTSFEILDNPDVSGTNDKASKVGAITNSGAAYEGINFDLGTQIDFTTDKTITMNFWADAAVDVLLKLEQGTGPDIEVTASHGGTGWEMISFDFNSSDKYVRVTLFVDGPGTSAGTFYIDDIEQTETTAPSGPTDAPAAPPTRDAADVISIYGEAYGAEVGLANVDWDNGSNFAEETIASNKLLKVDFVDFLGTQLNTVVDATEMTNFHMDLWIVDDFAAGQIFNPKWSNHTGGAGETNAFEYTNPVGDTDAKKWISIDIPITDFTGDNTRADLTQLLLAVGGTLDVVYVDNIYFYKTGGGGATCTAETMESLGGADLNLTFMSDPSASIIEDGGDFEWIDNPDFDNGVNSSCKVGKITKLGNNPWDNNQIDLDAKLDFNANEGLKIKVWSALANTEVRIKLEEIGNPGNNTEQFLTTSVTSGWEELTFPFTSADSDKFNKIVIFFDLNANNTDTYYFDDLMLYGTGGGGVTCTAETMESLGGADLNLTFMSDPSASIIEDGGDFEWIDNPDFDNGVNSSCKVGKITKLGNNPWDNNQIDLDAKLDFNANEGLKIKVWSALANTEVRIKLEEIGNPGNNTEQFLTTSVTSGWEELTFPFTSADSDKFNKIVIFFDLNANNTDTYYFDDLMLYGTGGGSSGTYDLSLPIDFESSGFGAGWTWNVFENDTNDPLEFVANPNASGINTSSTVAKITALQSGQPWVGTETAHGEMGITWDLSASNAYIKIMVYKTVISDVGIKLVNPTGGAQGEIKVSNTKINEWEELTFDFSGRIGNGLDGSTNIDQIVVFPDFNLDGRTSDNVVYFDNIRFSNN